MWVRSKEKTDSLEERFDANHQTQKCASAGMCSFDSMFSQTRSRAERLIGIYWYYRRWINIWGLSHPRQALVVRYLMRYVVVLSYQTEFQTQARRPELNSHFLTPAATTTTTTAVVAAEEARGGWMYSEASERYQFLTLFPTG